MAYRHLRSVLFKLDPEAAHSLTLNLVRLAGMFSPARGLLQLLFEAPQRPVTAFGLTFKNPVGLAAGYDKDGRAVRGLAALGFGHIEVGTVTPLAQPGNPRPRIFRLPEDEAVINRMGFPGKGAEAVAASLQTTRGRRGCILGVNLGKNRDTALEEADRDYLSLIQTFLALADYLAVNVSSPNTVGLRRLQESRLLESLLKHIAAERERSQAKRSILVKLSPDLSDAALDDAVEIIIQAGMDGIIACNTTLTRPALISPHKEESGGLSGNPLRRLSELVLAKIVRCVGGRIPIISAGGIMEPEDARRRLDMGATLVQVYTGLVYRGPGLVREIVKSLP